MGDIRGRRWALVHPTRHGALWWRGHITTRGWIARLTALALRPWPIRRLARLLLQVLIRGPRVRRLARGLPLLLRHHLSVDRVLVSHTLRRVVAEVREDVAPDRSTVDERVRRRNV